LHYPTAKAPGNDNMHGFAPTYNGWPHEVETIVVAAEMAAAYASKPHVARGRRARWALDSPAPQVAARLDTARGQVFRSQAQARPLVRYSSPDSIIRLSVCRSRSISALRWRERATAAIRATPVG